MKNTKVNKIILFIIALVLILSITLDVRADEVNNDGNIVLLQSNDNNTTNNTTNNTSTNVESPLPTTSNKIDTNSYTNVSNSDNLPKTGAEDYKTVFIILGVCAISAVYAYKKTRDYNGIK